jgi:hypothetical protein
MNVPEIGYMSDNVEPHLNMYRIDIWEKRFVWFEVVLALGSMEVENAIAGLQATRYSFAQLSFKTYKCYSNYIKD